MPPRATRKPRRQRKKVGYRSRNTLVPRPNNGISPFPAKLNCTLKYIDTFRMGGTATGLPYDRVFRGSSVFDPDWSTPGHQPMYFDQIAPLYVHYTVWASTITVRAISHGNGNASGLGTGDGLILAIAATNSSSSALLLATVLERPKTKYALMGEGGKSYTVSNTGNYKVMSPKWNKDLLSFVTGNPADNWFWHVYLDNVTPGQESVADIQIEIKYNCTFMERTPVAGS